MANYAWPTSLVPATFQLSRFSQVVSRGSMYGLKEQTVTLLNDRWLLTVSFGLRSAQDAAQLEAFLNRLRSGAHTTDIWNFTQPAPRGTCQSSAGLAANFVQGSDTAVILATTGQTLLAGDLIGIGGKLFRVAANSTASAGQMTVTLTNRASKTYAAPSTVTLQQPTERFRLPPNYVPEVVYDPNSVVSGVNVDFVEALP